MSTIDKDQLLALEVTRPEPGQQLTAVAVRKPYDREPSVILVDSARIKALMATTSDCAAPGSNESAIARAVRTASYTLMAALAAVSRPLRCKTLSRPSNASVPSSTSVMGSLSAMEVVRDVHRKTEQGTHLSARTVVFSAPQGWGKTRQSEALRKEFGCACVVDGFDATMRLTPGALHLTNQHPAGLTALPAGVQLIARGWEGGAA